MKAAVSRAVYYALASNVAVALCKYAAAAYTNSGSALAEAIHSSADCMNQLLLLIGIRAARNRADEQHPLGFGRETYFYALLVALQLFLVGGVASAALGVVRLLHRTPLEHPYVVVIVLCVSGLIEAGALKASIGTIDESGRKAGLWTWFRETGQPQLLLAIGEDAAALAGVLASLVAVVLSVVTGSPVFDACGSIAVGLILMGTAVFSVREIKSLIVGEAAHHHVRQAMQVWLTQRPDVRRVVSLIVLKWADDLVVAIQAELQPHSSADDLVRTINEIENDLKTAFPSAQWIFFEPELREHGSHPI
ncbi:cation diffusion facilitator family transporter [Paraburkholderia aspalathi]|uniref:Cation diffusion facilitator family transporter n=1 Tax=Paraburkholderia aspalathi TaxID=1324617 RepID=A0A1I7EQW8_9BURK|nr:cation diffusion facilitator family transporter [Paraburkholderia aspalathi]SFU26309.1 cation diffusion facilitator family transporter [Paraburkholderia aspalathi]